MEEAGGKLKRILKGDASVLEGELAGEEEVLMSSESHPTGQSQQQQQQQVVLCVECGDQPGQKECEDCQETFCEVCFHSIHRTGKRKLHKAIDVRVMAPPHT